MEFIKKLVAIIYIPKWYMFKDDKIMLNTMKSVLILLNEVFIYFVIYIYVCI